MKKIIVLFVLVLFVVYFAEAKGRRIGPPSSCHAMVVKIHRPLSNYYRWGVYKGHKRTLERQKKSIEKAMRIPRSGAYAWD